MKPQTGDEIELISQGAFFKTGTTAVVLRIEQHREFPEHGIVVWMAIEGGRKYVKLEQFDKYFKIIGTARDGMKLI